MLQNPTNESIPAYENIVIDKVIAKIGMVLAKAPKFVLYLKQFWHNAKTMANTLMVINTKIKTPINNDWIPSMGRNGKEDVKA